RPAWGDSNKWLPICRKNRTMRGVFVCRRPACSAAGGRRHFRGEVGFGLLDALAQREADKADDLDRRADVGLRRLHRLFYRVVRVDHESLGEEDDLLIEFADAALDH